MPWLRAKLSAAGLDTTGLKPALQHRYEAHLKQQETLAMVPLNSKDLVLLVGAVMSDLCCALCLLLPVLMSLIHTDCPLCRWH